MIPWCGDRPLIHEYTIPCDERHRWRLLLAWWRTYCNEISLTSCTPTRSGSHWILAMSKCQAMIYNCSQWLQYELSSWVPYLPQCTRLNGWHWSILPMVVHFILIFLFDHEISQTWNLNFINCFKKFAFAVGEILLPTEDRITKATRIAQGYTQTLTFIHRI